ncbi:MAG: 16S rRNA (cytidine(1402)-2'-O)-methyltransferase [Calditerrivibrio sp.]|uniref:16S rRNA (cytidine(1402)-2'-O)-methyltransferase n=1 Tax=Calditerrivibrio sp. TaxID=2792612 RepID=UPI003D0DF2EB
MLIVAGIPLDEEYHNLPDDLKDIARSSDFVIGEEKKNVLKFLARSDARGKEFILLNEHTEEHDYFDIVDRVKNAGKVLFFSDGGTPCVADPGYKFIDLCHNVGVSIVPYPGPSSITAALSISGFYAERFYFAGFLPKDRSLYKKFAEKIEIIGETTVIFERPYGMKNIIEFVKLIKQRKICIIFNIGKPDFYYIRGTMEDISNCLLNKKNIKSPFVAIIDRKL